MWIITAWQHTSPEVNVKVSRGVIAEISGASKNANRAVQ